jgi:hypothetical protein
MKRKRRDTEIFSLSFLDCICCGFGAIILLLVISEFGEPVVIEKSRKDLNAQLLDLQRKWYEIRGETELLNRELKGRIDELTDKKATLSKIRGELTAAESAYASSSRTARADDIIERELLGASEELNARLKALQAQSRQRRTVASSAVGGIPADSDYIIFLIDTSGSMQGNHWDTANQVMREILDIYPRVRGLQIVDDNGKELFEGTRGRWLEDSSARRTQIVERMRNWRAFSDSSPADGIEAAIRTYWAPDKRISIYVLGDEFTGDSIQAALDAVARVNRTDERGRRRVRIHAIGFPEGGGMPPFTNIRFSALMRAMCEQNDGTFVGLTNVKSCAATIEIFGVRQCVGG